MPFGKRNPFFFFFLCIINHFKIKAMENLPVYISIVFGLTTFLTVFLFYKAVRNSTITLIIILAWIILQAIIASSGFYTVTNTIPPRFMLLVFPPLLLIISLFFTKGGRRFLDSFDMKTLTLLHIIRVPVELVLLGLFMNKTVPEVMTFEGRNFDILSGLSAPVIYYFVFVKKQLNKKVLLVWNLCCLVLLINIVSIAVLAAPFTFQQLAFDQPNVAIFYFPFVWLPCCVVPIVLLSHLAAIRQLLTKK